MQHRIPAVFMRGGTSKALIFRRENLPSDRSQWDALFLAAIGSPDPARRQLNGMGGGVSSLSKVCVVGPSDHPDADVDYTFAQIPLDTTHVDYRANCGNMSSAIGPFAVDEGIVSADPGPDGSVTVRIFNTNTGKIIHSTFPVRHGVALTSGDLEIAGVPGTGAPIRLDFIEPGGAGTGALLPTGRRLDYIDVEGAEVELSMVDAANPCVFVAPEGLGLNGTELPDEIEARRDLLERLEAIRQAASIRMGLCETPEDAALLQAIPKIAVVCAPKPYRSLDGSTIDERSIDLVVRMMSMGQAHRAIPLTGALCVSVAASIDGTLVHSAATPHLPLRIGHPSGILPATAVVEQGGTGVHAVSAGVFRTARRLMEGHVLVPSEYISA